MEKIKVEFTELIIENSNLINKICRIYTDRQVDFEDLRQEIIFQLWKSYSTFNNNSKIQTWMYKVALNTALYYRRKNKTIFEPISAKHERIDDEENLSSQREEFAEKMYSAIKELNNLERAIIFLYLEKCSYEKISDVVGISEKNVSVKLTRIKEGLRKKLNS